MATVYPTLTGVWSTRIWFDDATGLAYSGVTPQVGDIVLANGKAITIDTAIHVASLRSTVGTNALVGGTFTIPNTNSVTYTVDNDITSSSTSGCVAVSIAGTNSCTITGSALSVNGVSSGRYGISMSSTGTLNLVATVTGGTSPSVNVNASGGTINITGNVTGGTAGSAYGVQLAPGATANITGNVAGSASAAGVGATGGGAGSTCNVTGNVAAVATGGGLGVGITGVANVTVSGTVTASSSGTGTTAILLAASCTGSVTGAITGGSAANAIGVSMSTGTFTVGTATGGGNGSAYGVSVTGAGTLNVTNANGASGHGVNNGSTGTINVTNATGGSNGGVYGVNNASTGTVNYTNATGGSGSNTAFGIFNASTGKTIMVSGGSLAASTTSPAIGDAPAAAGFNGINTCTITDSGNISAMALTRRAILSGAVVSWVFGGYVTAPTSSGTTTLTNSGGGGVTTVYVPIVRVRNSIHYRTQVSRRSWGMSGGSSSTVTIAVTVVRRTQVVQPVRTVIRSRPIIISGPTVNVPVYVPVVRRIFQRLTEARFRTRIVPVPSTNRLIPVVVRRSYFATEIVHQKTTRTVVAQSPTVIVIRQVMRTAPARTVLNSRFSILTKQSLFIVTQKRAIVATAVQVRTRQIVSTTVEVISTLILVPRVSVHVRPSTVVARRQSPVINVIQNMVLTQPRLVR